MEQLYVELEVKCHMEHIKSGFTRLEQLFGLSFDQRIEIVEARFNLNLG